MVLALGMEDAWMTIHLYGDPVRVKASEATPFSFAHSCSLCKLGLHPHQMTRQPCVPSDKTRSLLVLAYPTCLLPQSNPRQDLMLKRVG